MSVNDDHTQAQLVLQLQAQVLKSQEAAAAKDAEIAQAAHKLHDLAQQLAAHEHAHDSASASRYIQAAPRHVTASP